MKYAFLNYIEFFIISITSYIFKCWEVYNPINFYHLLLQIILFIYKLVLYSIFNFLIFTLSKLQKDYVN